MNANKVLKLTSPMMHGSAVRRVQEMTDLLGVDLGPNDGIYGPNTEAEVLTFQRHNGLKADGICGPRTWTALIAKVDQGGDVVPAIGAMIDRRGAHPHPKWYKCQRRAVDITGVTLHQTGCRMPQTPAGWDRLNAHIGVTRSGAAILVNDPFDWIWHGQGLSKSTIGIEIEGNYPGLLGDMRTLWKGGGGPHVLTGPMLKALESVFLWVKDWFRATRYRWDYVYGHRQSKDTRIADPGEEIWTKVGIPWSNSLKATDGGPSFCKGSGRPIPKEWAKDGRSARYFGPPRR